MPTQVQFRRGSTAENNNFTGASGELTVNTSNNTVRVHDGVTQGGFELVDKPFLNRFDTNLIPSANVTYDLGNTTHRFRDLYLSGSSIKLGGITLQESGNGLRVLDSNNTAVFTANALSGINAVNNTAPITTTTTAGVVTVGFAASGVSAGQYGGARQVPTYVVDTFGRITSAANVAFGDIVLGTETSGNYVGNVTASTGVYITGTPSEGWAPTFAIGQDVATTSDVQFAKVNTTGQVRITDATESTTAGTGALIVSGGLSVGANVNISGHLNVLGNVTTFSSNELIITDPLIYIGEDNAGDIVDLGLVASYTDGGTGYQHAGLVRDASDGIWKLFANVVTEPTDTIDFTNATYSTLKIGALTSDTGTFSGNVTTGNVSGTVGTFTNSRLGTVQTGTWQGSSISTTYTDAKVTGITAGTNISISGSTGNVTVNVSGTVSDATNAVNIAITNDTSTNSTHYPTFVSGTSGNNAQKTSSTKLTFNPSSGLLTSTDYNSSSDKRLKKNIKTYANALQAVTNLRGVSFDWKETGSKSVGLIAQEVEKVIPEVVTTDEAGHKGIRYTNLIGVLVEAIKEQQEQINTLKQQIEKLNG